MGVGGGLGEARLQGGDALLEALDLLQQRQASGAGDGFARGVCVGWQGAAGHADHLRSAERLPTKVHRLEENVGGAAVELTADELREINTAAGEIAVQGERYSEAAQKLIDR